MKPEAAGGGSVGLVIFDCDGVLVDSEPLAMRVLLEAVSKAGTAIDVANGYESFLGKSLATVSESLRQDYGVDLDSLALDRMRERLYAMFRRELRPVPGVVQALADLTLPCCVASSSQMERIRLALEVTGLSPFFDDNLFSASMVAYGKPAPDLFLYSAMRMGVDPARCVVVEDSPAGVHAATCAGMRVFAFVGASHARSQSHRQSLEALGPTLVFDDMLCLLDLLRGLDQDQEVS